MKIDEIQELIRFISKSGVSEVEIEDKDFKINIKTSPFRKGKKGEQPQPQIVTQMIPAQQMQAMPQQMAQQQMPVAPAPASEGNNKKEEKEEENNYVQIKSPMIGTFYRKSAPDKPEFVKVGDNISVGDNVCVIEAMKLFNEIESEISGKIVKVLVDDNSPVEYDQPLFLVEPA